MSPVRGALAGATAAQQRIRQEAMVALDFAIQQANAARRPDQKVASPLDKHIRELKGLRQTAERAVLETRSEVKAFAKSIISQLSVLSGYLPGTASALSVKAQAINSATREFRGHMKDLPQTIDRVATGQFALSGRRGFFGGLLDTIAAVFNRVMVFIGWRKSINHINLSELQIRGKHAEQVMRQKLMGPSKPAIALTPDVQPPPITFGTALHNLRNHMGPALSTFLRTFLYEHLPADSKQDIALLDPLFDEVASSIDQSPYRTLDGWFDQNALAKGTPKKQLGGKRSAEMCKLLVNILQRFFDMMPIDQAMAPQEKTKILNELKKQFALETNKVNALPDSATIQNIWALPDAPIVVAGVADLVHGIEKARQLRLKAKVGKPPSSYTKFALDTVPTLRRLLSYERSIKFSLGWLTTWPARYITGKTAAIVIRLFSGNALTAKQRQLTSALMPNLLKVLNKLDFTKAESKETRRKLLQLLNVIYDGVYGEQTISTKQLTVQITEALGDLISHTVTSEEGFASGLKAMAYIQTN